MTDSLVARMKADLTAALKARDKPVIAALRSTLAAIANAEAVESPTSSSSIGDSPIAGATSGLGSTEATRRSLTDEDVHALVRAEHDERIATAAQYDTLKQANRAADLRAEAGALTAYL